MEPTELELVVSWLIYHANKAGNEQLTAALDTIFLYIIDHLPQINTTERLALNELVRIAVDENGWTISGGKE